MLEAPLGIMTITSKKNLHLHFHYFVLGVYLGSLSSHDAIAPSSLPFCLLMLYPTPYQPKSLSSSIIIIIIHLHLPSPLHKLLIILGGGRVINTAFFHPLSVMKKKHGCCPDLTLIPSAFLKTTSTITIPPNPIDLVHVRQDNLILTWFN